MRFELLLLLAGCGAFTEVPRTYSSAGNATVVFADEFAAPQLNPLWHPSGPGARVVDGVLEVENLRNHPLWLSLPLPDDLRIEFDAKAFAEDGDIKVEFAGDGKSFARTASYTATGYVVIFGGWHNSKSMIAKGDEHGGQLAQRADVKVAPGVPYKFTIERVGGTISWFLDAAPEPFLRFVDASPLAGPGHEYFGFGNWQAPTRFDNLVITPL